jgi:carboxyl-terminal processing protease
MRSRAIFSAAVLSTALVSGGWLMQHSSRLAGRDLASRERLFDAVLQRIRNDYVDTISDSVLYRYAVDGALKELHDPHSVFLDQRRLNRLEESTTGQYAGVGIQIDTRDSGITVISTLPGSPAEQAGILTGDRIIGIDGRATAGLTQAEATKVMRGNPGTLAKLIVERPGIAQHMTFTLTRQLIDVNPVRHALLLNDGVGYVDLTIFSSKAGEDLVSAIDSLRKAGATSLVLDLRGDPGGLLDQGVGIADLFLDPGQGIVSIRGRMTDESRNYYDQAPQRWPTMPLVVLTDSNSASASEIVAGALQDHDRALVIGTATYGKGSAQRLFKVDDGALKLTTALWFTPSGRSINKRLMPNDEEEVDDDNPTPPDSIPRPRFRTDAGRTVFGGGGIVPDIIVEKRVTSPADRALQTELGAQIPKFRDAITEYALSLRASHAIARPDFVVTPAMRDELYRRAQQHGVQVNRAVYDADSTLVSRVLAVQISRYAFGPGAEFARAMREDSVMTRALNVLRGVQTPKELLTKVPATPAK